MAGKQYQDPVSITARILEQSPSVGITNRRFPPLRLAHRALRERGILVKDAAGGRSTSYSLKPF